MKIKKWQLLDSKKVFTKKWYPLEERKYKLPNGILVDDYIVTTLADVAMIVPVTTNNLVIMIKQYRPGMDRVVLQFPSGRQELAHKSIEDTAVNELEEETGIKYDKNKLIYTGEFGPNPSKSTEITHCFLAKDCSINSKQDLDENEIINVVKLSVGEVDEMIKRNKIQCAQTLAAWCMVREVL